MAANLVEGVNAVFKRKQHLPIASVFSATFYRLATLMSKMVFKQVNQMNAGFMHVEHVWKGNGADRDCRLSTRYPPRSYEVGLLNRQCDCGKFQALHYPCVHVIAACAEHSINVEQYVDEVYT
ncbi:hypothetical protein GOBAR_AA11991 [Gossypium barbadense]|uniref:SWIM-type domain-containing protein n=1 Tax=Gossypium barbadense TaxID=3634 RepID=A0A2P5XZ88_GOSBA|nr:hypothetical protein GOBAR_AA11991 [Gossypium barbadense]